MFSEYDLDNFPLVKVTFNEGPNSLEDFQDFTGKWLNLYRDKENFIFLFDTTNMKNPSYKYVLKMSQFISQLKKQETQYLEKSIILINSNKIKYLLDGIFIIQKPVAPVYIYNIDGIDINFEEMTIDNINDIINHSDTLLVEP